ncbi:MAG: hypothetical protein JNK82_24710 [Myxococcaceae bacterium]|nr:hypothetical protein [Myxococcaceae bacterium]
MRRHLALGAAVLTVGCGAPLPQRCAEDGALLPPMVFTRLGGGVCFEDGPCVGAAVVREASAPNKRRVRIAFVPDGFSPEELDFFRAHVAKLIDDGLRRGGLVARLDDRLEVLRVDLPETTFGGCLKADPLLPDGAPFSSHQRETPGLLEALLPVGADAVVMVSNTRQGRANATGPIHLSLAVGADVLDHELGHWLIGLGDEYTDTHDAFPTPRERFIYPPGVEASFRSWQRLDAHRLASPANLTTDGENPPWRHLVDGAVEGGARYATGIFHPTATCAMNRSGDPFCPVCSHEIGEWLAWHDAEDDGPPRCYFQSYASLTPLSQRTTFIDARCTDRDGLRAMEWQLDGETVWSGVPYFTLLPNEAHTSVEAQVNVSLDALPPKHGGVMLAPGRHVLSLTARDATGKMTALEWGFESVP